MTEMESKNATGRTDWETPLDFFKEYDDFFHFTVDVCADTSNHKVHKYYDLEKDGLAQDWSKDTCWCNPPYGRGLIDKWVKKASEESQQGATVVMLLPNRTSTAWFHDYIYQKDSVGVQFMRGRLRFVGADGSAMFGSMIVIFHPWSKEDRLWAGVECRK